MHRYMLAACSDPSWRSSFLLIPELPSPKPQRHSAPGNPKLNCWWCAGTNLTRIGVVVLALFAVSNPLLHIAKICNQLSLGPLKIGGFVAFAAAFFLSRVLLVPWAVLKVAALDSRWVVGQGGGVRCRVG